MSPRKAEAFLRSLRMRPELLSDCIEDWKRFLRYFPSGFSKEFKRFAADTFARHYNFLICYDRTDRQKAFCTYCGRNVVMPKEHSHNSYPVECPVCKHKSVLKHNWRFKTPVTNYGYIMQYDKADYDKQAVVCRAVYAVRCVYPESLKVEWKYTTRHYYLFKAGCLEHRERIGLDFGYFIDSLTKHATMYNMLVHTLCLYGANAENIESLVQAVNGTKWQYSMPLAMAQLGMRQGDGVRLLELYEKNPQIEYFIKAGFGNAVLCRLKGKKTTDIVNWRAQTMKKAIKIRLLKQDLKFIREKCAPPEYKTLLMYKLLKSENPAKLLRDWQLPELFTEMWSWRNDDLAAIHAYIGSVDKMCAYIDKQWTLNICKDKASTTGSVISDWLDYLKDCQKLELNMHDSAILMPANLHKAHQNTMKQIKIRADELINKQIAKNQKSRQSFNYAFANLFCRPADSSEELIAEGAALSHCVGTYAQKYAKAETHIIFIRRAGAPDVPFYTMEVSIDFDVVQVRGLRNCGVTEEVNDFVKHFKAEVLRKLKKKARDAA